MHKSINCILTNMVMVYQDDKILVQDKLGSSWKGICFPGGHVEENESFVQAAIREVKEETGLTISNLRICGLKQFTKNNGELYIVVYFKTNSFTGNIVESPEGKVFWIDKKDLLNYDLAEDFYEMYKIFINDELNENYYHQIDGEWVLENY